MLLLLALQGCAPQISADDPVRVSFSSSEMFHVAATYKVIAPKTEENPVALEAGVEPTFGEHWSDEVVWTYQVIDAGYTPSASDELYPYALTAAGEGVSQAWVGAPIPVCRGCRARRRGGPVGRPRPPSVAGRRYGRFPHIRAQPSAG